MLDEVTAIPDLPPMELPITDEPRTSFTLPSEYYTSPAVYEREKEAIFYRTWQYVAHRSAFTEPGDYATLRICDQNIFVMKGGDGVLRAFYNVCRHRAHELLAEPHGNVGTAIVCPYHAWTFEREGEAARCPLLHAPPRLRHGRLRAASDPARTLLRLRLRQSRR